MYLVGVSIKLVRMGSVKQFLAEVMLFAVALPGEDFLALQGAVQAAAKCHLARHSPSSALDGSGWLVPCPGHFTNGKDLVPVV